MLVTPNPVQHASVLRFVFRPTSPISFRFTGIATIIWLFMGIKATPKIYLRALINISRQSSIIWSLQWRVNGCDGVWNHQRQHCLLNGLFRRRSKKTSKLRVTGLSAGNSPVTGEFPAQMASNAEFFFHLMTSSCRMTEKQSTTKSSSYCNIGSPSKTHLTLNSCEISLAYYLYVALVQS